MLLCYIIPGHGQKVAGYYDPGAVSAGLQEAESVRVIAEQLAAELQSEQDIDVIVDGDGYYYQRHKRLEVLLGQYDGVQYDAVAVIHLHHNSSSSRRPDYCAVMWDKRSAGGEQLSERIGVQLARAPGAPWQTDVRGIAVFDDRRISDRPWLYRAWGCIDEVYDLPANVSASLLELGFISHPETREWFRSGEGVAAVAPAIARGVAGWLRARAAYLAA